MQHKRLWIGLLGLFFVVPCLFPSPFAFRRNITESMPYRIFLKIPYQNYTKGSYVVFDHPLSKTKVVKIIKGLPGDDVQHEQGHVLVSGYDCGIVKEKSPSGLSLKPIEAGVIPEGFAFAYSPHPNSFDSRYSEFGLIPIASFKEILWPLF